MRGVLAAVAAGVVGMLVAVSFDRPTAQGGAYLPQGAVFFHTGPDCGPFAAPYPAAHGRFPLLAASGIGTTGGDNTIAASTLPAHSHSATVPGHGHTFSGTAHLHPSTEAPHDHTITHTHGGSTHQHRYFDFQAIQTRSNSLHSHVGGTGNRRQTAPLTGASAVVPGQLIVERITTSTHRRSTTMADPDGSPSEAVGTTGGSSAAATGDASTGLTVGSVAAGGTVASAAAVTITTTQAGSSQSSVEHVPQHVVLRPCIVS